MENILEYSILGTYAVSLLFIFIFSIGQFHLTIIYRLQSKKNQSLTNQYSADFLPFVTVQLPIYNEQYVVERLLDKVVEIDYPKEKLEIQLLDDSTDDTSKIASKKIRQLQSQGFDIHHIRREKREGFKAGALQYGMQISKGEFIAIFDADFLPEKDFILKTIQYFTDNQIGAVQTRWGHINRNYSLFTKLQAFGLDAHFTIEQRGRNTAGSFINFNGTAGVWRKSCIENAGGWHADTLTEDLDLSYRAQLKGWKFKYLEDIVSPAELPVMMSAIKSQQFRWNKGGAESARKHLLSIWKSDFSLLTKIHGTLHLLNSSIFLSLLIASILSVPTLWIKQQNPELGIFFNIGITFLIGLLSVGYYYWTSVKKIYRNKAFPIFFRYFPVFLTLSMGLSFHNGMAVLEGLFGLKSSFIRTPKFNVRSRKDEIKSNVKKNIYIKAKFSWMNLLEGFMCLYFLGGLIYGAYLLDFGLWIFHGMLFIGYSIVFYKTIKEFF
jgi:cellulose synthase/poly-beta-1,6-N-acetylglucosamine synthase-like glycosyltransferase